MSMPCFNISAVERETGLSKDVLRMWERRYGFPEPTRDANGERLYPADQVERLRLIKRLMDHGHRPGKLIATPVDELQSLAPRRAASPSPDSVDGDFSELDSLLGLIRRHDANAYVEAMQQALARRGLQRFVQDIIAPLSQRVGHAWEQGRFEVFEEHLFTELTKRVLRQAVAGLPRGRGVPRILLTSVPDEQHVLGLLMVEAILALEGAECIPLGTQMPLTEINRAAAAHRADIVALSFSSSFPPRRIPGLLQQLRQLLPATVELWAGGSGMIRAPAISDVHRLSSLEQGLEALARWRNAHDGARASDSDGGIIGTP